MLLICYDPSAPPDPGPSRQPEHAKLEAELREKGVYVSGAGLWPLGKGSKIIRHEADRAIVIDGPFPEAKEAVGGYFMVDCSEEEALEYAKRISVGPRAWVQMRPVVLWHPK
jgi:hypothetical protein